MYQWSTALLVQGQHILGYIVHDCNNLFSGTVNVDFDDKCLHVTYFNIIFFFTSCHFQGCLTAPCWKSLIMLKKETGSCRVRTSTKLTVFRKWWLNIEVIYSYNTQLKRQTYYLVKKDQLNTSMPIYKSVPKVSVSRLRMLTFPYSIDR